MSETYTTLYNPASEADFLAQFQSVQGNPSATTTDMYAAVMGKNLLKSIYDTFVAAYNLTISDIQTAISALQSAVASSASTFVSSSTMSVASLISTYPPSATTLGKYARVSDLYGSVDDIMRCRYDGTNYRWVPQRDTFAGTTAANGGTVNVTPLVTPPTLRLTTGTLISNLNILPSNTNAYIGQRQRIIMPPAITLGIYTANITGLIGSNITLLAGNTRDIEFGPTGWFQSS